MMANLSSPGPAQHDALLRDRLRLLCARLDGELATEREQERWRAGARLLFDAAGEIAIDARRRLTGTPAMLVPLAQQIDLWVRQLGPANAFAKSLQSAPLYFNALLREPATPPAFSVLRPSGR